MIRHEVKHDKYAMRAAEERADIWHDKAAIATLRHDEDRQEAKAIKEHVRSLFKERHAYWEEER